MNQTVKNFEIIYQKYSDQVYRYILKICHNETVAEDILSMTFIRAIEKSDSFQGKCKVSTWLCRIAHNIYLNETKRKDNRNITLTEKENKSGLTLEIPDDSDIEANVISKEYSKWWIGKINQLPEPYGEVYLLRIMGEYSFKDIAASFDKSENWARVTFYRAKGMVKELVQKER